MQIRQLMFKLQGNYGTSLMLFMAIIYGFILFTPVSVKISELVSFFFLSERGMIIQGLFRNDILI